MTEPTEIPDNFDGTHRVTATEPAWVEQEHEPDDHGNPEPVTETTTRDGIDSLMDESTYECTCGISMSSWDDVLIHFQAVTDTEESE